MPGIMQRIARRLAFALAALGLLAAGSVPAGPPQVFMDANGVAIGGYDPVAYFEARAPVIGDPAFSHEWRGAVWRFASAAHRDAFAADPEAYAPRYGGHCAYAVAKGAPAPSDPTVWSIVEGRLYLNLSRPVHDMWREDVPGNIAAADRNWPALTGAETAR